MYVLPVKIALCMCSHSHCCYGGSSESNISYTKTHGSLNNHFQVHDQLHAILPVQTSFWVVEVPDPIRARATIMAHVCPYT